MSTYLEFLQQAPNGGIECGLGRIIEKEGWAKHDEVLNAIFAIDEETGRMFPVSRLVLLFDDEYGWSDFFYRRHREGRCVSCLKRTKTS